MLGVVAFRECLPFVPRIREPKLLGDGTAQKQLTVEQRAHCNFTPARVHVREHLDPKCNAGTTSPVHRRDFANRDAVLRNVVTEVNSIHGTTVDHRNQCSAY
jgi:hypothetical protein